MILNRHLTDLVAIVRATRPPNKQRPYKSEASPTALAKDCPDDFIAPEATARAIVEAGRRRRAEVDAEFYSWPVQVEGHRATAEEIIRADALARRGGHALPEPTGVAAEILKAGEKRRKLST